MPRLSIAEIAKVEPRWPENSDGIEAPEGICGDYMCTCADEARFVLTDGEYQLAFGVSKEVGLDEDDDWDPEYGSVFTVPDGWVGIHAREED